jgi:DHA1 family tetracycline resistance protein-like MFS transporter
VILTQLSSGLWAFVLSPLWALRSVTGTALNGLLSRKVGEDEQGMLQGMVTGLSGLTTMIGIPVMTLIFASATRDTAAPFNGAPFAAAATLAGAALLVLLAPNLLAHSSRNTTPPKRST